MQTLKILREKQSMLELRLHTDTKSEYSTFEIVVTKKERSLVNSLL
jgi:hypothetical protein